jgi:hypothetical protein
MAGIYTPLIGRFGNKLFQWAYAKALSEIEGKELITPPWEGNIVFGIPTTRPRHQDDLEIGEYRQRQKDLIYTRSQLKKWLRPANSMVKMVRRRVQSQKKVLAHRRAGDYLGYGYPVVSMRSYATEIPRHGFRDYEMVSDDIKSDSCGFPDSLSFVPDFLAMVHADVLFRGNSTFSWWAATLGDGEVYSPIIDGLEGGKEHDVPFVKGNHPRFCNLDDNTELHLKEE